LRYTWRHTTPGLKEIRLSKCVCGWCVCGGGERGQGSSHAVHLEAHHESLEDAFAALTRPKQISGVCFRVDVTGWFGSCACWPSRVVMRACKPNL
jgi:hypothetical protein